ISERVFLDLFKSITAPNKNLNIKIQLPNGELYEQPGKVAFIDNMIDKDTGTISIWTEFDNHDMKLMPGGYVSVLLSENLTKPLPGVKQSAIMADNHGSYVYVVGKDNLPSRRQVIPGDVVGNLCIIASGLKPGDMVVTDGTHKVIPGMPVNPVSPPQNDKGLKP
ncbi:MAG: efflux RND transporter periplasmic adaptor subunit, partial [Victivallaceae bacterium]